MCQTLCSKQWSITYQYPHLLLCICNNFRRKEPLLTMYEYPSIICAVCNKIYEGEDEKMRKKMLKLWILAQKKTEKKRRDVEIKGGNGCGKTGGKCG